MAKIACGGKTTPKKDLAKMVMNYGYVYVARIVMGASDAQTLRAIQEAESYDGPSIIIAYSHCIAHGINMAKGMDQQKLAVDSGYWPLYRYDPRLREKRARTPSNWIQSAQDSLPRLCAERIASPHVDVVAPGDFGSAVGAGRSVDRTELERVGISRGRAGVSVAVQRMTAGWPLDV